MSEEDSSEEGCIGCDTYLNILSEEERRHVPRKTHQGRGALGVPLTLTYCLRKKGDMSGGGCVECGFSNDPPTADVSTCTISYQQK